MALSTGARLGPYEILGPLGAGGMGEVYRARDAKLNRDVALKVLPESLANDPDRLARFRREAQVLAALNHPNIAHIHGFEDSGSAHALVMELVEGPTLADRIAQGAIPIEEALPIARQIADALESAHEQGIVHRDLKPANIKVRSDGTVKVLDFGLAKAMDSPSAANANVMNSPTLSNHATQAGIILGTAAYMSPEQAAGKPVDKRTDLWAFGVVLFEMLTGRQVFDGETVSHVIAAVLTRDPDWKSLPAGTPAPIHRLLHRCLERDRKRRLDSAGAARFEIDDALMPSTHTDAAAPPRLERRWLRQLIAATLVVASGVGLWQVAVAVTTPPLTTRRLAVSLPASQAFVDIAGNAVVFTPDGTAIVYSGRGPQGSQLYYRRLDQLEGTALPGTDNACCPAISPSGKWVAFESRNSVRKVAVSGGAAIELATVAYQGGITWGADDAIYSAEGTGLFRIPANGGPTRLIAKPDTSKHPTVWFMPMALPDGKTIMVMSQPGTTIAMVRIADGQVTRLDGDAENPIGVLAGHLIFGRSDGSLGVAPFDSEHTRSMEAVIPVVDAPFRRNSGVEASVSAAGDLVYVKASGLSRIAILDGQGRPGTQGSTDERSFFNPRISPDGGQVVVHVSTDNGRRSDLWLYDVASRVVRPLTTGVNARNPEWARGGRVVFTVQPDTGPAEAWSVPADRSAYPERLLRMSTPIERTVTSPDGRFVVVMTSDPKTKRDLYSVDLKGDRQPVPLEQSGFNEWAPAISPDGHWLAYVSDESRRNEVYVRPFPAGGAHVQVSADGGTDPRWAKDSQSLIYRNRDQFIKGRLTVGKAVLVYQRDALFSGPYSGYDLAPDGTIVALRSGSADAELIVVLNWLAELRAKVGKQ